MDLGVGLGGIASGIAMYYAWSAGVIGRELGDVPDLVVNDKPAVRGSTVF